VLEPGIDEHQWISRWEALEEDLREAPTESLSEADDLVAEMMEARGIPLEERIAGLLQDEAAIDRVVHLAAQTLQTFFTGGGAAREHAEYALADVTLLAPVLHPPAIRIFESERHFAFANPAAILPPAARAERPHGSDGVEALVRPTAVIGAEGASGGWTIMGELRAPGLEPPKDRDFALFLGPWVETDFVAQSHKASFASRPAPTTSTRRAAGSARSSRPGSTA